MPIRVKSYARGDSRDSLTSTDHLIAVYSMESKDPSFEASGATVAMTPYGPQPTVRGSSSGTSTGGKGAAAATSTSATAATSSISNKDSGSWMKGPWSVYFPPQLQMNVQQISERLKLEPSVNSKLAQHHAAVATPAAASNHTGGKSSSTGTGTGTRRTAGGHNKHTIASSSSSSTKQRRRSTRRQDSEGSCGYETEHKEDVEGNICILPLEQSAAFTASDDDSVSSWSSQAAVKFNKKLKPKVADHGLTTTNNAAGKALADPAVKSWEHAWGTKPSLTYSRSLDADMGPTGAERRTPKDSTSKDNSFAVNMEKRDESEAECPTLTTEIPQDGQHTTQEGAKNTTGGTVTHQSTKKSVRFSDPLVTSQYFRPRTRPEEVSMLFFDEDELELLEEDRETTSRDQFEMIAQELSENRLRISIAYQNRWRDHQRRRQSANNGNGGSLQVATSASDI